MQPLNLLPSCANHVATTLSTATGIEGNPPMYYDSTLGTPTAQGITPIFPQLAASIYEINGIATMYGWNPAKGQWV
jgi:hypothetical protein